jgi:nucleoside-diphosphate kinase
VAFTFALLKPEAVDQGLVGEIIGRLERAGLRLAALRMLTATRQMAEEHYGEEIERKYGRQVREWLLAYVCDGMVVPMVLVGDDAVATARATAGASPIPAECAPGTIRRDLSDDTRELATAEQRALRNLIHTADSPESAAREMCLWFDADALAGLAPEGTPD